MAQVTRQKDWQQLQWRINDVGSELDPDPSEPKVLFDTADHVQGGYRSSGSAASAYIISS